RDGDAESRGGRRVVAFEACERALELDPRVAQVAAPNRDAGGEDLVVERRHQHLDTVRAHDTDAFEQVLLGQPGRGGRALRRTAGELVDELVQPGRTDGAGCGADDELPACQLHQAGRTSTSDESCCFRYRTTWLNVSGGATCSDRV